MSAEKRLQNWILVAIVLAAAIIVPMLKISDGETNIALVFSNWDENRDIAAFEGQVREIVNKYADKPPLVDAEMITDETGMEETPGLLLEIMGNATLSDDMDALDDMYAELRQAGGNFGIMSFERFKARPAVNQGIDLVGGVDLLLQAHIPETAEDEDPSDLVDGAIDIIRNRIDPEGVKEIIIQRLGDDRIVIQIPDEDDPERVRRMIGATASLRFIDVGSEPLREGAQVRYVDPETLQPVDQFTLNPVSGEEAVPEETEEEDIELPGSTVMSEKLLAGPDQMEAFTIEEFQTGEGEDAETVKRLVVDLEFSAGLELTVFTAQNSGKFIAFAIDDKIQAIHEITDSLTDEKIIFEIENLTMDHEESWFYANASRFKILAIGDQRQSFGTPVQVFDPMGGMGQEPTESQEPEQIGVTDITTDQIILTGEDFADASLTFDQLGQAQIAFQFKPEGRESFGRHTSGHVGEYLAIALDNRIISCPVINEPILHGRGVISGNFSYQEAQDLVIKLDSGRLPVPLEVIENRTISPTLGAKSIDDSWKAAMLGGLLILLFMFMYYRLPGLLADFALIYYVIIFYGALAVLNATLTLPGIAGFILSVGMAVDANVIIFERLKEELRTGKTFRSATDTAFKRAFLAIFDANVTTLITALVLYNLGTGPIKGFAVTLSIGILVSMFSALIFTRLLIETTLNMKGLHKYSLFGIKEKDVATGTRGGDAQ